ncbi:hypothetical protein bsdtb5_11260 [Anaeromicropila herbilytica]|uniref:Uncharacterized protein n=1 Tax=Anaeromicropila herbilytica TaxID=2785025 RepID=A0A7R7EJ80_9FIRM|nr:hypothetical protein bsdtb5_11260 [Anaeromicropila herbilytica]
MYIAVYIAVSIIDTIQNLIKILDTINNILTQASQFVFYNRLRIHKTHFTISITEKRGISKNFEIPFFRMT